MLSHFRETGGDDVGLTLLVIKGKNQVVEAEVALRQLEVIDGGTGQSLNKVTEVIAEVTYRPADERHGWGARPQVVDFEEVIEHIEGVALQSALFSTSGDSYLTSATAHY